MAKWAADVAAVVNQGGLDGVFIDGYRGTGDASWAAGLIPKAKASTKAAWVKGAWEDTGAALAAAIPHAIRLPNGNSLAHPYIDRPPGYNAISIEFFAAAQIPLLQKLAQEKTFVEVHSYIGDNRALFNSTLAAYLVSFGENAFFGAGNTWDTCESWLVDYQIAEYHKPLGMPLGVAMKKKEGNGGVTYTRKFASGTHVSITVPLKYMCKAVPGGSVDCRGAGDHPMGAAGYKLPTSCVWWSDGSMTGTVRVLVEV